MYGFVMLHTDAPSSVAALSASVFFSLCTSFNMLGRIYPYIHIQVKWRLEASYLYNFKKLFWGLLFLSLFFAKRDILFCTVFCELFLLIFAYIFLVDMYIERKTITGVGRGREGCADLNFIF